MGSGSTKVMRQSEWVKVRAKADTVSMIEQRVTQIRSEKGLFCGEGGEEFLQRDRVDLEIYLEDIPDFVQLNLKNFILRRPNMQPYDLRQFAAYQLGRLLWMLSVTDVELEGRFLLGLRDRHTPLIQLLSDKVEDRKVVMEMDVRVNINGDSTIQHLLMTDAVMQQELAPKCAFAEALLDADLLEAKRAKNPTMEFLTGDGKRLFRKKRVNDLPDAPRLSDYEAAHLPDLIGMYYDALYRSALWRRYQELKFGKPADAEVPPSPPPRPAASNVYPEAAPPPPPMALAPPPAPASLAPLWPVERDPYDYTKAPYPNPPQMWAEPISPSIPQAPYPGAGAMVPLGAGPAQLDPGYRPTNMALEWPGPIDPNRPNGNYNNYAGPTYQMFLPTQY